MLKKTITYTDFFDQTHTEDFYFHLTKAELTEMAVSEDGILVELQKITGDAMNGAKVIAFFRKFILDAHGVRSDDGKRFIKSEESRLEFSQSAAFDHLLNDLVTYKEDPVAFMKAILPADLAKAAEEKMNEQKGLPQDFRKKA